MGTVLAVRQWLHHWHGAPVRIGICSLSSDHMATLQHRIHSAESHGIRHCPNAFSGRLGLSGLSVLFSCPQTGFRLFPRNSAAMAANGFTAVPDNCIVAGADDPAADRHLIFAAKRYCLGRHGFLGIYLTSIALYDTIFHNYRCYCYFSAAFPKAVLLFTGNRRGGRANAAGTGKAHYAFHSNKSHSG